MKQRVLEKYIEFFYSYQKYTAPEISSLYSLPHFLFSTLYFLLPTSYFLLLTSFILPTLYFFETVRVIFRKFRNMFCQRLHTFVRGSNHLGARLQFLAYISWHFIVFFIVELMFQTCPEIHGYGAYLNLHRNFTLLVP